MARREGRAAVEARRQREIAAKALERGNRAALAAYVTLERLEPEEPDWAKRAADCCRRLGQRDAELAALERSAAGYVRGGFTVKAIAVCKRILALDPSHRTTQQRLAELHAGQALGLERLAVRAGAAAVVAVADATAPVRAGASAPGAAPVVAPAPPGAGDADALRPAPGSRSTEPVAGAPVPGGDLRPLPARRSIPPGVALEAVTIASLAPSRPSRSLPPQRRPGYEVDLGEGAVPREAAPSAVPEPADVAVAARPYTPLFSEVGAESFAYLVDQVALLEVEEGGEVFHEGDAPDALYVVAEGQLEVVAEGPPRGRVGLLGDGDFFGEIGLLSDVPRQRTVRALEPSRLLVLDRRLVADLVDGDPAFLRVLLRFLRERLVAMLFRSSELFAPFGPHERQEIVARFRFLELEPGATLIEEGRRTEGLFVLLSGAAEVVAGDPPRQLATLSAGDVFGEMSLLSGLVAVAGVRTTQKAFALLMPARDFTETVMTHPHVLAFTSELAERRARENEAAAGGAAPFAERRLELV